MTGLKSLAIGSILTLIVVGQSHAQEPMGHWIFDAAHRRGNVFTDETGHLNATVEQGTVNLSQTPPAIILNENSGFLQMAAKGTPIRLPKRAITAEAWVSVRSIGPWRSIIGYMQDNGSFERGWLLGAFEGHFGFGISASGKLTYLNSKTEIQTGPWYHLVGTYDGSVMKLYVNGELDATSTSQKGDIQYADSWFTIGRYKDDDENFNLDGLIHEVKLYESVLTADRVRADFNAKKATLPTPTPTPTPSPTPAPIASVGPYLQFTGNHRAKVMWETAQPAASILEWGSGESLDHRIADATPKTHHAVTIEGLHPRGRYAYRIKSMAGGQERAGFRREFNMAFNYTVPDFPTDAKPFPKDRLTPVYEALAEKILAETGITKGYCLDYNIGEGRLAYALTQRSDLIVIGVTDDAAHAQTLRKNLTKAGIYGTRVTVQNVPLDNLPFPDYFANLVVSERMLINGKIAGSAGEMLGKVRPLGGTAYFMQPPGAQPIDGEKLKQWMKGAPGGPYKTIQDGQGAVSLVIGRRLPGSGSWQYMYGDAGQTASSHDMLVHGTTGDNIEVQWMGQPGPDAMIDRQSRNQGPLGGNGRLFTQGDDRLIVQDSYNGAILWSLEIPGMRRVNVKVDTSNACLDDDYFYLAKADKCWRLDAYTGKLTQTYSVTADEEPVYDWGYVGSLDGVLLGSGVRAGSSFSAFMDGPEQWYENKEGDSIAKVCSDYFFALDKKTGRRNWTYKNGVIMNATISMGGGRIYFIESRNPAILASGKGRIDAPELYRDLYMIALDQNTGAKLWEKAVDFGENPLVVYLVYADEDLVVQSSNAANQTYNLFVYGASDGRENWNHAYGWRRSDHGHAIQHPVVVADKLFAQPEYFNLKTGQKLGDTPDRKKCGTMTASGRVLHYRDYNDEIWDLETGEISEFKGLRSSCWLGLISSDGLLLSAESGGGCSCNFHVQISLGYRTKNDY